MNNADPNPLTEPPPEASASETAAALQQLHDFKNQLGGLKLYATFLKKSLANNTLDAQEGVAVCDKMMQQIDALTARAKAVVRHTPADKS